MQFKYRYFNVSVLVFFLIIGVPIVLLFHLDRGLAKDGQIEFREAANIPKSLTNQDYTLDFSTYLGGSNFEQARDVFVDDQGNVYVTGGTKSTDFPTTKGPGFNNGACPTLGPTGRGDVFVAKYDPNGNLVWSRLLGGPCYDRAYGIELDSQGYVLVAGRAGEGFPVTPGAFQTTFQGIDTGFYGWQNAFVAKILPDGSAVEWASYVGVGQGARDIALDDQDNIYLPLEYQGQGGTPPPEWFVNAYQPSLQGGKDSGAIKINSSGTQVMWATWLGGSDDDSGAASIRVDGNKNVYLATWTISDDIPTTYGAFDNSYHGGGDYYVARLSSDGSNLIYGTYLGGSGDELSNTHNLALDGSGNLFVTTWTNSTNFPTTPGVIQANYGGGSSDIGIAKFSPTGGLLASSYLGGIGGDNPDGMYATPSGDLYMVGVSDSGNFPVTGDAYQSNKNNGEDAVLVIISANLNQLIYATFMGGTSNDNGRTGFLASDGSLLMAGQTDGSGWPTKNADQPNFGGGQADAVIAKLSPSVSIPATPTATTKPGITPTPQSIKVFIPLISFTR